MPATMDDTKPETAAEVASQPEAAPKPKAAKPKAAKKAAPKKAAPEAEAPAKPKKKYDEAVTAVAKATRAALPDGARAPGAKQIARVMEVVGQRQIADAAGISLAKLRKWARDGERPEEYKALRELADAVDDPWVTSRRLAMVLIGMEDYGKAGSK